MIVEKRPTSSQPYVIATGPPCSKATKYDVRQPARIEMIVNEIAKFWNPPIAAEELLRVAELVQDLLVVSLLPRLCGWCRFHPPSYCR